MMFIIGQLLSNEIRTLFLSVYLILKELLWQFSYNTFKQLFNLDHFPADYDHIFSF